MLLSFMCHVPGVTMMTTVLGNLAVPTVQLVCLRKLQRSPGVSQPISLQYPHGAPDTTGSCSSKPGEREKKKQVCPQKKFRKISKVRAILDMCGNKLRIGKCIL